MQGDIKKKKIIQLLSKFDASCMHTSSSFWQNVSLHHALDVNEKFLFCFVISHTSSAESQKGFNVLEWCSVENQKMLSPQTLYSHSALLVLNGSSLNSINTLLALNWWYGRSRYDPIKIKHHLPLQSLKQLIQSSHAWCQRSFLRAQW